MTYLVISPDGELHRRDQQATSAAITAEVGEPGWAMAPLLQGQVSYRMPPFLWPYLQMHDAIVAAGGAVTCHHIDLCDASQIRHMAVWVPGRIVCHDCAANNALSTPDDARETWLCDRCLQHRPGRVSASVMRLGATLVWFGICRDCHAEMQTGGEL